MAELALALAQVLAPPLAELLAAAISSLAQSIRDAGLPVTTAGVVREIVEGVARDHPDWPGKWKRETACAGVRQYLENHGATADDRTVNLLIEAAVAAMVQPNNGGG